VLGVFEVAFRSAGGGHVALDDISFSPEFCSTDAGELHSRVHAVIRYLAENPKNMALPMDILQGE